MKGRSWLSTPLSPTEVIAKKLYNGEIALRPKCAQAVTPKGQVGLPAGQTVRPPLRLLGLASRLPLRRLMPAAVTARLAKGPLIRLLVATIASLSAVSAARRLITAIRPVRFSAIRIARQPRPLCFDPFLGLRRLAKGQLIRPTPASAPPTRQVAVAVAGLPPPPPEGQRQITSRVALTRRPTVGRANGR